MPNVVIISAKRTPIGRFLGSFSQTPATELAGVAGRKALEDAGVSGDRVDEAIFGHARLAGTGPNTARQAARAAGLPDTVPAFTVNKACGSGLKSVLLAAQSIRSGEADVVLAGGMENMSRVPYLLDRVRSGVRLGHAELIDAMYRDGFADPLSGMLMGETAEKLAVRDGVSRREQDEFALESQRRAAKAWDTHGFDGEIVPVTIQKGRSEETIERDEHPRPESSLEKLAKLPPVFHEEGTVSAGNSSGITDGAAALVLMREEVARRDGHPILARLVASSQVGVDPSIMGIAPVPALRSLFEKTKLGLEDIDLFELNEAFAAQVLSCLREIPIPMEQLNVNGGAIALGHPIGATGARILVTLVHEMRRRELHRGVATLCISGGLGLSLLIERE